MKPETQGKWYRSNVETFAAGQKSFNLSFLANATGMRSPVVDALEITFDGSVGSATNSALAADDAKTILSRVTVKDGAGLRVNLSGAQIAELEQLEFGANYSPAAALAQSTTNASYSTRWRIPFNLPALAAKGADTAMPLSSLVRGEVQIEMDASLNNDDCPVNSGNLYLRALIRDEGTPEAKTRIVWDNVSVSAVEDNYAINAGLRAAWFSVKDSNGTGYNDASGITELDSKSLDIYRRLVADHVEDYRHSQRDRSSSDLFLAASTARNIPIVWPYEGQKIARVPEVTSLHVKQDGALVDDQKLVVCKFENRSSEMMAAHFGFNTAREYEEAIATRGYVKGANGNRIPVSSLSPIHRSRLPIRLA